MPDLATTLDQFALALSDAKNVDPLLPYLAGDAARNARRLALYRGNLIAHWTQALGAQFPVIAQFLGQDFFTGLTRAYVRRHPPQHADLGQLGVLLAHFLGAFEHIQDYPFLPDLAELEWAIHCSATAADEVLTNPQEPALLWQAGTVVLSSRWPIYSLWQAHQPLHEAAINDIVWQPEAVIVYRDLWEVKVSALNYDEGLALQNHIVNRAA